MPKAYITHPDERRMYAALRLLEQGQGSAWMVVGAQGFGKSTLLDQLQVRTRRHRKVRQIRVRCRSLTEPTTNVLEADATALSPVSQIPRDVPDNRALWVIATILRELGRPHKEAVEGTEVPNLFMDPRRIAASGIRAIAQLILEAAVPLVSIGQAIVEQYRDAYTASDFGDRDLRRLSELMCDEVEEVLRQKPTLLLVDDAHFMDAQSCDALFAILDCKGLPCMMVLGAGEREMQLFGETEPWHPLSRRASSALISGNMKQIRLEAWSRETVHQYCRLRYPGLQTSGAPEVLWKQTSGFPLYIDAVLTLLEQTRRLVRRGGRWRVREVLKPGEIPDRISEAIREQLRSAGDEIQALLERASIEGPLFHYAIVSAEMSSDSKHDLRRRLQAAEYHYGLIRRLANERVDWLGGVYAFFHSLTREYIYAHIPIESRRLLHGLVADALIQVGSDRLGLVAPDIVRHSREAGQWHRVVTYLLPCAEQALGVCDWATALMHTEAALALVPHAMHLPETVLGLRRIRCEALYRLRRWDEAVGGLEELLATGDAFGADGVVADALCRISHIVAVRGAPSQALQYARRALEVSEDLLDPKRRCAALVCMHRALQAIRSLEERLPYYRRELQPKFCALLSEAEGSSDVPQQARAHRWLARVARTLGDAAAVPVHLHRGLELARQAGDYQLLTELHYMVIELAAESGDSDAMLNAYRAGIEAARLAKDRTTLSDLLCNFGSCLKEMERYSDAQGYLEEALEIGERLGSAELICMAQGTLASLKEAAGAWEAACLHHREHLRHASGVGNQGGMMAARIGLARCQLLQGDACGCLEMIRKIPLRSEGKYQERVELGILTAKALLQLNLVDQALDAISRAQMESESADDGYWRAQTLLARGEVAVGGARIADVHLCVERARSELATLVAKWPGSVPLRLQYERAVALGKALNTER